MVSAEGEPRASARGKSVGGPGACKASSSPVRIGVISSKLWGGADNGENMTLVKNTRTCAAGIELGTKIG